MVVKKTDGFNIIPFIEKYFKKDEKIILACSTGADSMFLLYHLLETEYKKNVVACYFHHQTRTECDDEQKFLEKLGKKEGFAVEIATCDFKKIQSLYPNKGFEELAREKRYQFFEAVCNIYDTDKVLLAHHLDDKIETFIFNMLRGTKLTGLINMKEQSGGILRPLLGVEKKDIYKYLETHKLQYFEDITNKDNEYSRNFIRNEITSKFEQVHPEHKKNLSNLFQHFEELQDHLESEISVFLNEQDYFKIQDFNTLTSLVQKEVIRKIYYMRNNNSTIGLSQGNITEILRFFDSPNNKTIKEIHKLKMRKDGGIIYF